MSPPGQPPSPASTAVGTVRAVLGRWWHRRRTGSRTRRLLERHLAAALFFAVLGTSVLLASYREVDRASGELRTASAPAVQSVITVRLSLLRAHEEAERSVEAKLGGLVGAGEEYRTQLSAARRELSRLGGIQIDGVRGRAAHETVTGLVDDYANSLTEGAVLHEAGTPMWEHTLGGASSVLTRRETGVVFRLDALQDDQFDRITTDTTFGALQTAGWAVAELALAGLALTVLSALRVLRRRCGRTYDGWLAAALLLTVALAVLPLWATTIAQSRLDSTRDELATRIAASRDGTREVADRQDDHAQQAPELLAGSTPEDWRAGAYYAFLAGGAMVCVLPAAGCVRRLNADYWRASS
jgi:hypothetical protein